MSDIEIKKLKSLDRIFLKRLKLLKLPIEERVTIYSTTLNKLNNKFKKEIEFFEENKIDETILKSDTKLSPELINLLKTKELIQVNKKSYKEASKPVQHYIYTIKDLELSKASIQFHHFLLLNNKNWQNSYRLVQHIEDFIKREVRLRSKIILTEYEFYDLEKEVEKRSIDSLSKARRLRRYIFLNANREHFRNRKQLTKKNKVYQLIENYPIQNLENSNHLVYKKEIFESKYTDKDLMQIDAEMGINKFVFKYFDF